MKILHTYTSKFVIIALLIAAPLHSIYAQTTAHKHKKTVAKPVPSYKDSIRLETMVNFDKDAIAYKDNKTTYADVVKFTLKITNGSTVAVPDPIAYKGSKFVKMFINGHLTIPKALFDESETAADTDKVIKTGESQTFYCDWLRSNRSALLRKYGKKFFVQFAYLNKLSPKVYVDLTKLASKQVAQAQAATAGNQATGG